MTNCYLLPMYFAVIDVLAVSSLVADVIANIVVVVLVVVIITKAQRVVQPPPKQGG